MGVECALDGWLGSVKQVLLVTFTSQSLKDSRGPDSVRSGGHERALLKSDRLGREEFRDVRKIELGRFPSDQSVFHGASFDAGLSFMNDKRSETHQRLVVVPPFNGDLATDGLRLAQGLEFCPSVPVSDRERSGGGTYIRVHAFGVKRVIGKELCRVIAARDFEIHHVGVKDNWVLVSVNFAV